MSQKVPSDGAQKGFAVGRGLLAAAETLNFSMSERRSDGLYGIPSRPSYGMASALGGGEGKDRDAPMSRGHSGGGGGVGGGGSGGGHLSSTMKLFNSLGLSPTDVDALSQIPEENISVETLPHLIMQLKSRKAEAGRRMGGSDPRDLPSLSPERSYRPSRDDWDDIRGGRMGGSGGQGLGHGQQVDYGYNSMQEGPSRGYDRIDYGESSSGGGRDRPYSELSRDRYGDLGLGSSSSSNSFMPRRTGAPSHGKVQDFLGVMPQMFPHVCSLCDFDVHSTMEWTQHTNGLRHSENRRILLQVYPDWRPQEASSRVSGSLLLETTNRSDGILGPAPLVQGPHRGGMNSNWGLGAMNQGQGLLPPPKIRSRVVVAKYERKPLTLNSLLVLAQPFGTVCEHLVLKNKAFLEMQTHEEAVAMVTFYQRKPAVMHGKEITFYLSRELVVIEKGNRPDKDPRDVKGKASQVVFFSNLPREREKKSELLTLARRFGTVEKYLFLSEEAFVQLGTPEDAEMMVKYYTLHPLTIRGRSIRLNICTKYKTLIVNPSRNMDRQDFSRRSSSGSGIRSYSKSQKSPSSGDRVARSKEQSASKEEELKADDIAMPEGGEGSGDEVAGVIEADDIEEGDHEEAGDEEEMVAEMDLDQPEPPALEAGAQVEEEPPPQAADAGMGTEQAGDAGSLDASAGAASEPLGQEEQVEQAEASPEEEAEGKGDSLPAEPSGSLETQGEEPMPDQDVPNEQDFPENMDDFVTLDEVAEEEDSDTQLKSGDAPTGSPGRSGGLRVVNVVGFKRGYNFLDEILMLAKPFGKVVRHLVLKVRPEAFLELSSEEEARAMVDFYSGNVTPMVCGKAVKIYHSQTYATIQNGRVIYVGQLPPFQSSDASLLKIAEPFGKVRRYFLNRIRNECFIEMKRDEDAERMASAYKDNPPKFHGKRLTVYLSRKYKQLKHGYRPPKPDSDEERPLKRERSEEKEDASPKPKIKKEEEPPAKKTCVRAESAPAEKPGSPDEDQPQQEGEKRQDEEGQGGNTEAPSDQKTDDSEPQASQASGAADSQKDAQEECKADSTDTAPTNGVSEKGVENPCTKTQAERSVPEPLGPYQPNNPVGVEYVKMGYYCRVCFLFYSNEETAKKVHCSSLSHYEKLKKYLSKDKTKTQ
uniref:Matrin 3-like 1.1 n=1 Tax=Paramormyrops kingsleyae TaxID=1676925 RepID=A0A3B3R3V0_9TELE